MNDPLAAFYATAEAPRAPSLVSRILAATHWSQGQLAAVLGIPRATLASWVAGRGREALTSHQARRLASSLVDQMAALQKLIDSLERGA